MVARTTHNNIVGCVPVTRSLKPIFWFVWSFPWSLETVTDTDDCELSPYLDPVEVGWRWEFFRFRQLGEVRRMRRYLTSQDR
jgi:hypothetical protein